jgi:glycine cleavage system H protein
VTTEPISSPEALLLLREAYFDDSHLWVLPSSPGSARCGFDPLGVETSGDIVALSFEPTGTSFVRGQAFGSIEAAKFVGPLIAPVSGTLTAHNEEVLARPTLLHEDPALHWLVELTLADAERELARLRHGEEDVRRWLDSETARFKQEGMIAE